MVRELQMFKVPQTILGPPYCTIGCRTQLHFTLWKACSSSHFSSDLDEILDSTHQNRFVLDNEARFSIFSLCRVVSWKVLIRTEKIMLKLTYFGLYRKTGLEEANNIFLYWKVCYPPLKLFFVSLKNIENCAHSEIFCPDRWNSGNAKLHFPAGNSKKICWACSTFFST